jgi:hypothetical protein
MNRFFYFVKIAPLTLLSVVLISCHKNDTCEGTLIKNGNILIRFAHLNNGNELLFDTMIYKTSVGNQYLIDDLQYFISGFQLHKAKDKWLQIGSDKGIHYIDAQDKSTFLWKVTDGIPPGIYDSVSLIFGLDAADNISFRFPDPPERDMFWPEILGGGYHYMKMDLKWKNNSMTNPMPFMFHLGIGQMYQGDSTNTDSIIGYIQNYFTVKSASPFVIDENKITQISFIMNIEKWFDSQNAFDFSDYPMGIMQNQLGMYRACLNGRNAFVIK